MRTARVFYLLLSVLQFIFFLKLVEYVRGDDVPSAQDLYSTTAENGSTGDDEEYRGLFMAPKMKNKKMRKWNQTSSQSDSLNSNSTNATEKVAEVSLNSNQPTFKTKREQYEHEIGRLCPACENNQCTSIGPIPSGFPIVPVIIAIFTGIAWFILFLIFWIFHTRPNTKGHESGGYGGYGSESDSGEEPDIFHHFLKPHERSLQSYTRLLHNVLDSVGKLSDLYNSY